MEKYKFIEFMTASVVLKRLSTWKLTLKGYKSKSDSMCVSLFELFDRTELVLFSC